MVVAWKAAICAANNFPSEVGVDLTNRGLFWSSSIPFVIIHQGWNPDSGLCAIIVCSGWLSVCIASIWPTPNKKKLVRLTSVMLMPLWKGNLWREKNQTPTDWTCDGFCRLSFYRQHKLLGRVCVAMPVSVLTPVSNSLVVLFSLT